MRVPRQLLLSTAALVAAACAAPHAVRPGVDAPVADLAEPVAVQPEPARGPPPRPVLQVIPPGDDVHWGGAGGALTVTGRHCETSIVDTETGRVTARIPACRVWPSPTRDVFAVQMDDGTVVTWDRSGARGATLGTGTWAVEVSWSAEGRVAEVHDHATTPVRARDAAATRSVPHLPKMVDARWSADGLYLSARVEDGAARSLVVLAAGSWREVWRREGAAQGTWSTTGSRLAVTSEATGLEVLDATTASTRPLPSATTAWFERLYQAPDGALMAPMVPRADGRCQAVRVAIGGEAAVVELPTEALQPWWSPDGSRMLVRTVESPNMMVATWRLYVDDRAMKEHTFVDHGYGGFDVAWSSRAHRLLVVHGGALLFDADTHRVWKVPVKQPSASALDADGARAALETPEGLQVVMLASKEPPILLSPGSDPPPALLALSGSRLAAVTREGEVSVWDVEGRTLVASWEAGFSPEHVAWLGEGERLALSRRDVLHLSDLDGSNPVTVTALRDGAGARLLSER